MDLEEALNKAKRWSPHSTFRVVLGRDEKEIPVVPNYGWTFSMYHPPVVKENPNLSETTELLNGAVVVFHGIATENWDNQVFCFSMLHAPNTQFFISPAFFENLVPIPVTARTQRGMRRGWR